MISECLQLVRILGSDAITEFSSTHLIIMALPNLYIFLKKYLPSIKTIHSILKMIVMAKRWTSLHRPNCYT